MVFTLTDPRMQAISQAGANFGGGLGDALSQFVENKQFNKALEGVTAETPILQVLQQFAKKNVSPDQQNRFLSATVQQALQKERGRSQLQNLKNTDLSNLTPAQLAATLLESTQDLQPGTFEALYRPFLEQQQNNLFKGRGRGRNPTLSQPDMQPAGEQNARSSEGYSPQYNNQALAAPQQFGGGQGQQPQGQGPAMAAGAAGAVLPGITPNAQQSNAGRGFQQYNTYEDDIQEAYDNGARNLDEAIKYTDIKQNAKQQREAQEAKDEQQLLNRLDEKFPPTKEGQPGIDPALRDIAVEDYRYETGTPNERANKAIAKAVATNNLAKGIVDSEKRNWWQSLKRGNTDQFYDSLGNSVRQMLTHKGTVEALQPNLIDYAKSILSMRGDIKDVGIAKVMQLAINKPQYNKEMAVLRKLPDIPQDFVDIGKGGIVGQTRKVERAEKALAEAQPKVVNYLVKTLTSDPYASPVLIRDELIKKNYPESLIKASFDEAIKLGWAPSPYQKDEYAGLGTPQKQTAEGLFFNQKAKQGFIDQIFGVE
jgi:hypothetical protein